MRFRIEIDYPTDVEVLRRLSKRLFGVFYAAGCIGLAALAAGIWQTITGHLWWRGATAFAVMLAMGLLQWAAEEIEREVRDRLYAAHLAERVR